MQYIYKRIEFWIIIFFLIRLIGITNPPLEISHSWRQVTGLMVARNFLEIDSRIQYPRVDDNQGQTGIIGMEFPFMNYLFFGVAKILGYTHWYGRLLNLILSSLGIYYFFEVIRKYFSPQLAFTSSLILLSSIWFSFSRKTMPDTACISLIFIGLFYGLEFMKNGGMKNLILYTLLSGLAILIKIPAGIYLSVFVLPMFSKDYTLKFKIQWCVASAVLLSVCFIWYFVWNPYLSETYGNWYNSGKPLLVGFREIANNLNQVFEKFYFSSLHSFIFFTVLPFGLYFIYRKKERTLLYALCIVSAAFLVYIFKSGYFFYHHDYYIIPYVPMMALTAGFAVNQIKNKWLFCIVLLSGMVEAIANQQHDLFIKPSEKYKLSIESIADSVSQRTDLIVVNGDQNPQLIYLSHRKGWTCNNSQLLDSLFIQDLAKKGCRYVFVDRKSFQTDLFLEKRYVDDNFCVYKIH